VNHGSKILTDQSRTPTAASEHAQALDMGSLFVFNANTDLPPKIAPSGASGHAGSVGAGFLSGGGGHAAVGGSSLQQLPLSRSAVAPGVHSGAAMLGGAAAPFKRRKPVGPNLDDDKVQQALQGRIAAASLTEANVEKEQIHQALKFKERQDRATAAAAAPPPAVAGKRIQKEAKEAGAAANVKKAKAALKQQHQQQEPTGTRTPPTPPPDAQHEEPRQVRVKKEKRSRDDSELDHDSDALGAEKERKKLKKDKKDKKDKKHKKHKDRANRDVSPHLAIPRIKVTMPKREA